MEIIISNEITIKECNKDILNFCEKSLYIENPEYEKLIQLRKSVYNVPKKLCLFKKNGNNIILPIGLYSTLQNNFDLSQFKIYREYAQEHPFNTYFDIELYEYQNKALKSLLNANNGILISPTGTGKTQIGIAYILKKSLKALWVTHTKDLLQQSFDRASQYIDKTQLGTITAGKINIGSAITFATIQTLNKINLDELKEEFNIIIVDECHRVSGTPTKIRSFAKVINTMKAQYKFGLTATLHRSDGLERTTKAYLGDVVHTVNNNVVENAIVKPHIESINTGIGLSRQCFDADGLLDYNETLNYLGGNEKRNNLILNKLLQNSNHSNLILASRIELLKTLFHMLPEDEQERAIVFSSKLAKKERDKAIFDMKNGTKNYMFATYNLAKEGLDIPVLDRLYFAHSSKDKAVITQSIGRICRKHDKKTNSKVYDFVDDYRKAEIDYRKRRIIYKNINCTFD